MQNPQADLLPSIIGHRILIVCIIVCSRRSDSLKKDEALCFHPLVWQNDFHNWFKNMLNLAAHRWYHGYNNNNVNTSDKIDKTLQILMLSSKLLSLHSNLLGFLPGFSPRHLTNFHETTGSVFYGVVFWWGSSKNTNTCQHYALMKQTKPGQMYRLQIIRNLMQLWTRVLFLSQPHSQPLTVQHFIIYCKWWKLG